MIESLVQNRFVRAGGLALLLLLLALSTMFVSGHDRGFFYQPGEQTSGRPTRNRPSCPWKATVRRLSERLAGGCAVAAAAVFVLSSQQMHRPDSGGEASDGREIVSDCAAIRSIAAEGLVVVVRVRRLDELEYCLTGRILVLPHQGRHRHRADFLLTRERTSDGLGLLTPGNSRMFLYNRAAYDVRYAALGDPVLEGGRDWKVHRVGTRLIYTIGEASGTNRRSFWSSWRAARTRGPAGKEGSGFSNAGSISRAGASRRSPCRRLTSPGSGPARSVRGEVSSGARNARCRPLTACGHADFHSAAASSPWRSANATAADSAQ